MKLQLDFSRWKNYLHFDVNVLQVLLQRGWQIIAGGVTLIIVPWALTATEQGYYFTFSSLLALQVFFELGLNVVITQTAGHEVAKLIISDDGRIEGDPDSASRLLSLLSLQKRWYRIAAPLFGLLVMFVGILFFQNDETLPPKEWVGPWLVLVLFTAINLYFSPHLAMLEGIGRVGPVARLRLFQSTVGMLLMWIGLSMGLGLWAVLFVSGAAALATAVWLSRNGKLRVAQDTLINSQARIEWRQDIFPMQWRIALSWLSGWIIWNSFTPMLFIHQGAEQAGRLGLALSMFMAITTLGMSWVTAALPQFLKHIALGERMILNQLFKKVFLTSASFVLLVSLVLLCAVAGLKAGGYAFSERIASLPVLGCLMLATMANSFVSAAAVYMRAHKEEPMLWPSITMGVLAGIAAWFGSQHGALAMTAAYMVLTLCIALPWTIILFRQYHKK